MAKKEEKKHEKGEEKHSRQAGKETQEKKAKTEKEEKHKRPEKGQPKEKHEKNGHKSEEPEPKKHKRAKEKPKKGKEAQKAIELKPAEAIEAIIHLANEGQTASEIGMTLRDQYGIPKISKLTGKKLSATLKEQNLLPEIPEDLMNLIRKSVVLREHLERNKKDMTAKHGLMVTVSKIRSLEKYYKQKGKLPLQWRYTPEIAALLAK